ncbi:hypothetical protein JOM56_015553 [Amanita muscaria]
MAAVLSHPLVLFLVIFGFFFRFSLSFTLAVVCRPTKAPTLQEHWKCTTHVYVFVTYYNPCATSQSSPTRTIPFVINFRQRIADSGSASERDHHPQLPLVNLTQHSTFYDESTRKKKTGAPFINLPPCRCVASSMNQPDTLHTQSKDKVDERQREHKQKLECPLCQPTTMPMRRVLYEPNRRAEQRQSGQTSARINPTAIEHPQGGLFTFTRCSCRQPPTSPRVAERRRIEVDWGIVIRPDGDITVQTQTISEPSTDSVLSLTDTEEGTTVYDRETETSVSDEDQNSEEDQDEVQFANVVHNLERQLTRIATAVETQVAIQQQYAQTLQRIASLLEDRQVVARRR